jgi:peptidoglycan/xylan/chitin deacetylase (PgdA/CDA1 family)
MINKKILYKIIRYSFIPFLFRELLQRYKVTILLAHDIDEKSADKIFSYLNSNYNLIPLECYLNAVELKNNKLIPQKSLIITFDDGHIGNYKLYPILKKYNMPITIFLCAGIINTNRYYWFKYLNKKINKTSFKKLSNKERLGELKKIGFSETKEFERPQALNKKQIEEMADIVNFQAHTLFHPILPNCTDIEAKKEIVESKLLLQNDYKLKITTIAYPNGDFSDRDILICKNAGYKCGLTARGGFNTIDSDLFRLKRLSINDTSNIDELIVRTSGVWAFLKLLLGKK